MKEALSIETERMDDLPLLLTHLQRMRLAEWLDKHIPTHRHRKGLSIGQLSVVWLAHILSQADHRMNRVQEWATRLLETLRGCGMSALCPQDVTDDRLAAMPT
jgi:transposase